MSVVHAPQLLVFWAASTPALAPMQPSLLHTDYNSAVGTLNDSKVTST